MLKPKSYLFIFFILINTYCFSQNLSISSLINRKDLYNKKIVNLNTKSLKVINSGHPLFGFTEIFDNKNNKIFLIHYDDKLTLKKGLKVRVFYFYRDMDERDKNEFRKEIVKMLKDSRRAKAVVLEDIANGCFEFLYDLLNKKDNIIVAVMQYD